MNPAIAQEFEPGIVDPFQSQLPVALWTSDDAESSAALMRNLHPADSSAINRLRIIVALAQSFPALSSDQSNAINAARLNMLINHGVLDAAEALAQTLNWYPPLVRAEVETIALLTTRPERYCARLLAKQFIEIEQGMSIYCMVRSNKWQEAIDIFNKISETYTEDRRTILHRFLELDGENNPILDLPWDDLPKPFDFKLDEAFGRPRGMAPMPPSYIYYAREVGSTPRAELEYAEMLARWGAVPENVLFAYYKGYTGEEAGEAYQRAHLAQQILAMDVEHLPSDADQILSKAIMHFADGGLLPILAAQIAPVFAHIDLQKIKNNSTRNNIMRLAILGGWSKVEWADYLAKDDFPLVLAFSLRHPEVAINNLLNEKLPTKQSQIIHKLIFEERIFRELTQEERNKEERIKVELTKAAGEEILLALNVLDDFLAYDVDDVIRAFKVLHQSGQTQFARNIAINMLFGGTMP